MKEVSFDLEFHLVVPSGGHRAVHAMEKELAPFMYGPQSLNIYYQHLCKPYPDFDKIWQDDKGLEFRYVTLKSHPAHTPTKGNYCNQMKSSTRE